MLRPWMIDAKTLSLNLSLSRLVMLYEDSNLGRCGGFTNIRKFLFKPPNIRDICLAFAAIVGDKRLMLSGPPSGRPCVIRP